MAITREYDARIRAWGNLWSVPDLPARVSVTFSGRIRRALGRCTPSTGSIRLNPGLRDAGEAILDEVLCHESAHVAAYLLHGRRAPHGREWAALMLRAGYEPKVRWAEEGLPASLRTHPARRRTTRPRRARRRGLLAAAMRVLGVRRRRS